MECIITTGYDYRPDPGSVCLGVSCCLRGLQAGREVRGVLMIYQGDCLEIMPTLADKSVDLTVTSPPYDNLRTYNGNSQFDFEGIAKEIYRVTKDGGVVVWVVGDATINGSETGTSFKQALYFKEIGFNLHDTMIYQKDTQPCYDPRNKRCKQIFEYMFVFSKSKPTTYNEICDVKSKYGGKIIKATKRKPDGTMRNYESEGRIIKIKEYQSRSNIWVINTDKRGNGHPAQFPERLATDHILLWSNEGDTVLDPFAGSGTTGIAALNTGRKFILIEKDAGYCDIIRFQSTRPRGARLIDSHPLHRLGMFQSTRPRGARLFRANSL